MSKSQRLILLALASIQFTIVLDFVIMMPLGPQIMRKLGIEVADFGILLSAYTFAAGVISLVVATIIDKFNRKHIVLTAYTFFLVGTLLCGLAGSYWSLLVGRVVAGVGSGLMGSVILTIIGDVFPESHRGRATGVIFSSFSIASISGIPAAVYLAAKTTWEYPFFAVVGLGLLVMAMALVCIPNLTKHINNRPKGNILKRYKNVITIKNHIYGFLFIFSLVLAGFTIISYISAYLVRNCQVAEADLMYVYLFGGIFTVMATPIVGKLSDKIGKSRMFVIGAFISVPPILLISNLVLTSLPWILLLSTLFIVTNSVRIIPAFAQITSSAKPEMRGTFLSLITSVREVASGCSALLAGFIIQDRGVNLPLGNFAMVGWVSTGLLLLCVYLMTKIKVPTPVDVPVLATTATN